MLKKQGFPKCERIVSQKQIDELFGGGQSHSLVAFPLRAVYKLNTDNQNALCNLDADSRSDANPSAEHLETKTQMLVSVPKRRFKHAVDRNRVKRQLREAYRRHRQLLVDGCPKGTTVWIAFVWLSDKHMATAEVEKRVVSLLHRIAEKSR